MLTRRWATGKRVVFFIRRLYFTSDDERDTRQNTLPPLPSDTEEYSPGETEEEDLSFFQGGSSYETLRRGYSKGDPLNIEDVDVPWVDDWFRTRQGSARIQLLGRKTQLSIDQVQRRISKLLSVAPGLQKFMPLLHPTLFSTILSNFSHSLEMTTMLKSELPAIDLGIVVSGFPRVLTWNKKLLYDCMCFLVVHYKGRQGAAEALNEHPLRLKFTRQLLPELFIDWQKIEKPLQDDTQSRVVGRLYQFNKRRKRIDPPQNTLVFFENGPRLRE